MNSGCKTPLVTFVTDRMRLKESAAFASDLDQLQVPLQKLFFIWSYLQILWLKHMQQTVFYYYDYLD